MPSVPRLLEPLFRLTFVPQAALLGASLGLASHTGGRGRRRREEEQVSLNKIIPHRATSQQGASSCSAFPFQTAPSSF